ncbi:hypothetical protein [Nocardia sp. NPDC050710]|uniref:hypothetical protein n=1 Tax=Nocardia sp. NPDC050710 TaxID=3157220 RepID=UPI0033FB5C5A
MNQPAAQDVSRPRLSRDDRARIRRRRNSAQTDAGIRLTATGTELRAVEPADVPDLPESARAATAHRRAHAKADNTRRSYASAWRRFEKWCDTMGVPALPAHPEVVAAYLAIADDVRTEDGDHAYAMATLELWNAAIGHAHSVAGFAHPGQTVMVTEVLSGSRRLRAEEGEETGQAPPLLLTDLRRITAAIAEHASAAGDWKAEVYARRDIALLVLGYAGGFRRSEVTGLWVADVTKANDPEDNWLQVRLRSTKTSPTAPASVVLARGTSSPLNCPWCAFLRWLTVLAAYDSAAAAAAPDQREDYGAVALRRRLGRQGPLIEHICRQPWPDLKARRVPLFRPLDHGLPRDLTALSGRSLSDIITKRARQAGYPEPDAARFSGHSLRAGLDTDLLERGASPYDVGKHTRQTERTVRRYDRNDRWTNNPTAGLL